MGPVEWEGAGSWTPDPGYADRPEPGLVLAAWITREEATRNPGALEVWNMAIMPGDTVVFDHKSLTHQVWRKP